MTFVVAILAFGLWEISPDSEQPVEAIATAAPPPQPPKHTQADTAAPGRAEAQQAQVKAPTRRPTATAEPGTVIVTFTSSPAPMSIEVR
jgi:hypothetical protein